MDVSKGILRLSKSQKQSIVEGVGANLDFGKHDVKANTLVSHSISSTSSYGNGILYSDIDGTILSMDGVLSYDGNMNSVSLHGGKIMDVSKGILRLSKSQKQSIVNGVTIKDATFRGNTYIGSRKRDVLTFTGRTVYDRVVMTGNSVTIDPSQGGTYFVVSVVATGTITLTVSNNGEVGQMIFIENSDDAPTAAVIIAARSVEQFIFDGINWRPVVSAAQGSRRRLLEDLSSEEDPEPQKSGTPAKDNLAAQNITSAVGETAIIKDIVLFNAPRGCVLILPKATGSGREIRIYVQSNILPGHFHTVKSKFKGDMIVGSLISYNEAASSAENFIEMKACSASATDGIILSHMGGGGAGGYILLRDAQESSWATSGQLRSRGALEANLCW